MSFESLMFLPYFKRKVPLALDTERTSEGRLKATINIEVLKSGVNSASIPHVLEFCDPEDVVVLQNMVGFNDLGT